MFSINCKYRYQFIFFFCFLFSINYLQAQTNVSGIIGSNTTWTKAGSPYNITGNTQISVGVSLTIQPGAKIVFTGDFSFRALGNIIAIGNATDSIYFETNSPNTKIGKGIYIRSTASANLDVNYVYLSGTIFKYASFKHFSRGVFFHETGVAIENCTFYNNDIAIEPRSNLKSIISNSVFKANNYGLFTYGEDQSTGDNVACIQNLLITDNDFSQNSTPISIGMNQRAVKNFKVTRNKFFKNTNTAVSIGGGGYGPYVSTGVEISYNNFIENNNAISVQVYNLGDNGCGGNSMGGCNTCNLLIQNNLFYKDVNAVNLNGIGFAFVQNNLFNSNLRGVYIGTGSDMRRNNTIQNNHFLKVESPVVIYANGIYYQTENNLIKKNTFQTFLLKQSNPIININSRVNNNAVQDNNFLLYDSDIVKNTDIGRVPFTGNYTMPSRTIANDIYDQNDNIDLGLVEISSPSAAPITTAPISMPVNVVKSLSSGRVVLTWTANAESDIAGYKIYYGGFTGYSYTTSADAGNVLTYTLPAGVAITEEIAVTAYDASKDGTDDQYDGNESWYSPANIAPAAPSNLVVDAGARKVKLSWTASPSTGIDKYNVYRSVDGINFTFSQSTKNTNLIEEALTPNVKYFYRVTAFDSLDLSYDNYGLESQATAIGEARPDRITYVSPSGNNTTGIGSAAAPYLKIQKAIDQSSTGDTVYVRPGTYNESILINKSILVKSTEGPDKTKLIQESGIGYSIKVFNPAFSDPYTTTRIDGFYMNGNGNSNNSTGLRVEQKAYATLDNVFMDGYDVNLSTYYGHYNVNNSIFYGSRIFALGDAGDSDKFNIVRNSTIVNTSWSVYEASTSSTHRYYNLIITNEKSKPFQSPNPFNGPRPFLYNVILDKTFANYNPQDGSTRLIVDNAESMRFKNLASKDFSLENTSPAIGYGNSLLSNTIDYAGQSRPNPAGSNPDAGAFENIFNHPAPYIDTDSSRNGIILLKMTQTPAGTVNKISVYKGLAPSPTTKYSDTTLVSRYPDSLNSIFNKVLYYRLTSTGSNNIESGFGNEIRTIAFTPPSLTFPSDKLVKSDTAINFQWEKIDNATNYKIQISTDSNFLTGVIELSKADTFILRNSLVDNTTYFWRVQTNDSVHFSKWSNPYRFQTFIRRPILSKIVTSNNRINLTWAVTSSRNLKAFKIYRATSTNPTVKIDSISSSIFSYNDSVANGIKYFYRITAINTDDVESDYSNELFANSFNGTALDTPVNNKIKEQLKPTFKWRSVQDATKYNLQISTDSLFGNSSIVDTAITGTSLFYTKGLADNTTFYWRVRAGDDKGYSNWTKFNFFQTYVLPPSLLRISPANKIDTLAWSVQSPNNIKYFKIYRDTIRNPIMLLDSIAGSVRTYIDTNGLRLNVKYYYRIVSGNNQNIESDYSNELSATPFNRLPKAVSLSNKTFNNVGEFNYVRTNYSAVGSVDPDGQITSYKWFVNDSLINDKDSILINFFNQGTNKVKLIVTDNDGGKDSSSANVTLSSFVKSFQGGFLGGIAALSPNIIYTADTTYSPINGASISRLDRSGNTVYPLVVSSKIFTTPSVSSDSSVFITSGSSLNGFNKSGAPLWSTIPLGGLSYVTPTIDSLFNRIYVGVSNKNFFAIDYKTGKVVWNLIGDAPVNASAIITGDRKLVFTSQTGTLYGFDIRTNVVQTAPKWTTNFGEIITKSPAVDANNNLIIGTETGKVLKVTLNEDGTITRAWSVSVNASIQSSPVIDGDGFIYVGNAIGDFYKLNADNGDIVWKYETGGAIKSTPSISEFGNIYISNTNGLVTAITTNRILKWTYQADGPISANMLYINNMLYVGTERGKFLAIYDNPSTNTVNTNLSMNVDKNRLKTYSYGSLASANPINFDKNYDYYYEAFKQGKFNLVFIDTVKSKEPVWGTFQGNFRRTGSKKFECPETPVIQVPNCVTPSDSIRISTNTMTNRYWIVNDVKLTNVTSNSIVVKTSDKFKLMAFNSIGCEVLSGDPTFTPNSNISKPEIVTSNATGIICEGDSIILSSSIDAAKYQWNYAGAPITNQKSKVIKTNLAGAYSLTVINNFGCSATSDLQLVMVNKNPPAKPTITAAGSTSFCTGGSVVLNSSSNSGNQWYKDGLMISNATLASYTASVSGKYSVRVLHSGGCIVASDEIQVLSDVSTSLAIPIVNNFTSDSTICFKDSLVLKSSTFYDKYLWSNGDTTSTTVIRNSAKVSLRGRLNGSTCFSLPSATATAVKNSNAIPEISSQLNSLVSTSSNNYKWFKNNLIVPGITANVLFNPTVGVYRVETSLDQFCWDASRDFMVITNNQPLVTDTVQLTVFPNPSSGIFNVVADFEKVTNVVTKVTVVDINGVLVYQSQRLLFFSKKIMLPVNLGTRKGVFGVHMDINGKVKSIVVVVN
jgi:fibronectin type 3 domain-containing protein